MHPRICVSPVALGEMSAASQVELLRRVGARYVGFYTHCVASAGGVDAVTGSGLDVEYLVHRIGPPAEWPRSRELLLASIDIANELGARFIYFTTGAARQHRFADAAAALEQRLGPIVRRADAAGIALAIENTHALRSDLSFAFAFRDTTRLARQIGLSVVLDLFAAWIEPDLADTVSANLDILRIVQVSDFRFGSTVQPNRWVPGDGDIPLAPVIADLLAAGYRGLFDIELLGRVLSEEGPESALRRSAAWLASTLAELGVSD